MNAIPDPAIVTPDLDDPASKKPKKVWTLKPIRDAWENLTSRKLKSPPADAVAEFLADMKRGCQRRSKISPVGRRKTSPFYVMPKALLRVVPVVHRRDPRGFA